MWLGHAAFKLDVSGVSVLIDPFLTGNPLAPVKPDEVPADYILITHAHGDHIGDTVAIANRTNALVIAPAEITNWLKKQGVKNTHGQAIGGSYAHPFGQVKLVRAEHGSALPDGSYGGLACGFVLTINGKRLYFAGDTALYSDMSLVGEMGIDVAFLPIGDNYTMGPEDSLKAVRLIHPRAVFPIHYNTWDVIHQDAAHWASRVHNETDAKAIVLDPGSSFDID
jgi:L-ascorbate metabolism protein UlaG (beta-lactamase superfamily)